MSITGLSGSLDAVSYTHLDVYKRQKEDVVFALDAIADPVSLFEPIYHDGGEAIYVMDQVKDCLLYTSCRS